YRDTTAMILNSGTITDASGNNADLILPVPGNAGSLGANKALVIDGVIPTVSSVTSVAADTAYGAGDTLLLTLNFNKAVTVTGTPQLALETGTTDAVISYASGSGTNALNFQYIVATGDTSSDLDYTGTTALALGDGSIVDAVGNTANLILPAVGAAGSLSASKTLVIDGVMPAISTVSSNAADSTYIIGDTLLIVATFSEAVLVSGTPQLKLETGAADAVADYNTGSGTALLSFQYIVAAGDNSADLDYTITTALALNSGTITDAAGNVADLTLQTPGSTGSLGASKALVIDGIAPIVYTVSSSSTDGIYNIGDTLAIAITFSDTVTVTGTPQLTLETGSSDVLAAYHIGSGTTTLNFRYIVANGHIASDLDYDSTASLALNGGTINDRSGNAATLTLPVPGSS
ncbi:MAG: hypothetical protein KAG66_22480, partial [Methylococcales bacterium]|nr:hypothetical protein [Methylococcales bacterium]